MLVFKRSLAIITIVVLAISLVGCGGTITKQEDVIKELDKIANEIDSYHLEAKMTVDHDGLAQSYYAEVWYLKPELYKVALKNDSKEVSQIIIKNVEGVHVVNPYMNKVFKFSKDWPHAKGQLYLYQTLLDNILKANALEYEYKDDTYNFKYQVQNGDYIANQEVKLQEGFYPKVAIMTDETDTMKITVEFENFEANINLTEADFNVENQLQSSADANMAATAVMAELQQKFVPLQPEYIPSGLVLKSVEVFKQNDLDYAVLQYVGDDNNLTIIERPDTTRAGAVSVLDGELLELYGKAAVLTSNTVPTIQWYSDGMEFTVSGNIPMQEMEKVAVTIYSPIK